MIISGNKKLLIVFMINGIKFPNEVIYKSFFNSVIKVTSAKS